MADKTSNKQTKGAPTKKAAGKGVAEKAAGRPSRVASGEPAPRQIERRIRDVAGWRGRTLARMRALILEADPGITEEVKWRGTPVWSHDGIVCTGESYAKAVKLTFARGASLPDPSGLFNSSLDGKARRAIDIREGQTVNASAFKALVKAAVARNSMPSARQPKKGKPGRSEKNEGGGAGPVKLLSGGNPQIAKADGDAPVQAYIAAMPGWKRDVGRRLDALVGRTVPRVRKAVRWNTPFYGVEGRGWFLGFHCFTKYVKVTFLKGASLRPLPPGESKHKDVRYLDVREHDPLDDAIVTSWIRQASELPGEALF